jgi:thiamine kinase-like enzyme
MSLPDLSEPQRALLDAWLPGAVLLRDHSWELRHRQVLEVLHEGIRYAVKAGGEGDHHMAREIRAHREWLGPWVSRGRAPEMVHADLDALVLVARWLPGRLVETSAAAQDSPHRIDPAVEARLRDEIASWDLDVSTVLVPTHGDWQPRNWLIREGVVSVIDLGRADLRTPMSDLTRLAAQDFRRDPALEAAFLDGYGDDPREPSLWRRMCFREAIGTASWAFQYRDEGFERQGHRMIAEALDLTVPPIA